MMKDMDKKGDLPLSLLATMGRQKGSSGASQKRSPPAYAASRYVTPCIRHSSMPTSAAQEGRLPRDPALQLDTARVVSRLGPPSGNASAKLEVPWSDGLNTLNLRMQGGLPYIKGSPLQ